MKDRVSIFEQRCTTPRRDAVAEARRGLRSEPRDARGRAVREERWTRGTPPAMPRPGSGSLYQDNAPMTHPKAAPAGPALLAPQAAPQVNRFGGSNSWAPSLDISSVRMPHEEVQVSNFGMSPITGGGTSAWSARESREVTVPASQHGSLFVSSVSRAAASTASPRPASGPLSSAATMTPAAPTAIPTEDCAIREGSVRDRIRQLQGQGR